MLDILICGNERDFAVIQIGFIIQKMSIQDRVDRRAPY